MFTKSEKKEVLKYISENQEDWEFDYETYSGDEDDDVLVSLFEQMEVTQPVFNTDGGILGKTTLIDLSSLVLEKSFMEYLYMLMDERGIEKDSALYNKAGIPADKWSKYKNHGTLPHKDIVLRIALTMELSIEETEELLRRAGHALRPDQMWDNIIRACIEKRFFNMNDIDEFLVENGLDTVGPVK